MEESTREDSRCGTAALSAPVRTCHTIPSRGSLTTALPCRVSTLCMACSMNETDTWHATACHVACCLPPVRSRRRTFTRWSTRPMHQSSASTVLAASRYGTRRPSRNGGSALCACVRVCVCVRACVCVSLCVRACVCVCARVRACGRDVCATVHMRELVGRGIDLDRMPSTGCFAPHLEHGELMASTEYGCVQITGRSKDHVLGKHLVQNFISQAQSHSSLRCAAMQCTQ